MISNRCKGFNLLNHYKQVNRPSNINIKYSYDKKRYRNEWNCLMTFVHDNKEYSFNRNGYQKRKVLQELINEIDHVIRDLI